MKENTQINIETIVNAPIKKVWKIWTTPEDIMKWNNASPDWQTPKAENDFKENGKFSYRMEAKDGTFGFDFWGIYKEIIPKQIIKYTLEDERKVTIIFTQKNQETHISQTFEADNENPIDMQKTGWQLILDNFKKVVEEV